MADSAVAQPEVSSGEEVEETFETIKLNVKLPSGDEASISVRFLITQNKPDWHCESISLSAGSSFLAPLRGLSLFFNIFSILEIDSH